MTRALALVVALYVVWRLAVALGRRRERALRQAAPVPRFARAARCSGCGRTAPLAELRDVGPWPLRRLRCAAGCGPAGSGGAAGGDA